MIKVNKQDIGKRVIRAMPADVKDDGSFTVFKPGEILDFNDNYIFIHYLGDPADDYNACLASWLYWEDECKVVQSKLYLQGELHG
jgi:hypothetical protein